MLSSHHSAPTIYSPRRENTLLRYLDSLRQAFYRAKRNQSSLNLWQSSYLSLLSDRITVYPNDSQQARLLWDQATNVTYENDLLSAYSPPRASH